MLHGLLFCAFYLLLFIGCMNKEVDSHYFMPSLQFSLSLSQIIIHFLKINGIPQSDVE